MCKLTDHQTGENHSDFIVTILTKFLYQKCSFSVSGDELNQYQHENVFQRRENN